MHWNQFFTVPRRAFAFVLLVRFLIAEPFGLIAYGGTSLSVPLWVPVVSGLMWTALFGLTYMEREVKNANANALFKMFCILFLILGILYQLPIIKAICENKVAYVYLYDGVLFLVSLCAFVVAYALTTFWPAREVPTTFVLRPKMPVDAPKRPTLDDHT